MRCGFLPFIRRRTEIGATTVLDYDRSIRNSATMPISKDCSPESACSRIEASDRRSARAHLRRTSLVPRTVSKAAKQADWYVWAPPREDGTAPNNWLSAFGGPAWSYHPRTPGCPFIINSCASNPSSIGATRNARAAALRVLDRWLDRGVDGFRLDVANAFVHDASLTDNPPVPNELRTDLTWSQASYLQYHRYDSNLPENLEVLDEIRRRVEQYRERFVMENFGRT